MESNSNLVDLFQDYTLSYNDFLLATNQTNVLGQLAIKFLDNFPNQLPPSWNAFYTKMAGELRKHIPTGIVESITTEDPFMGALLMSDFFHSRVYGEQPIHYYKAIVSIYLVMFFSHINAFLGESIKIVANIKPEIVPIYKNKSLDFEERMDNFIKDLTMPNLGVIFQELSDLGINIEISPEVDIRFLEMAELQRHAYVHNGGRANSLYIKKSNDLRFKIGDDIVFTEWQTLHTNIVSLGSDVYQSICRKYLNIPQAPYWKIGKPKERSPEEIKTIVVNPPNETVV